MEWSRGGARSELEWPEIDASARRARVHGAELQVALNTIPRPREEGLLRAAVPRLLDMGVRTLSVNDVGLLAGLARQYPALRLTASIGCGAQTPADVAAFADLGAAAVVLPATIDPDEARACVRAAPIAVEIMVHMVEEFVLLGRCAMPGYFQLHPTPLPGGAPDDRRQSGSMKRGGVGACFKVCQQPWFLEDRAGHRAERAFPARQLSRLADVPAYVAAGVEDATWGVDGFIMKSFEAMSVVRARFPEVPIHASVACNIRDRAAMERAKAAGATQFVASTALSTFDRIVGLRMAPRQGSRRGGR